MIIPSARHQTPSTPNEARAKRNNLGEAERDDPEGRMTTDDISDSSREAPHHKLTNGAFAHADTDKRKELAFSHASACDD